MVDEGWSLPIAIFPDTLATFRWSMMCSARVAQAPPLRQRRVRQVVQLGCEARLETLLSGDTRSATGAHFIGSLASGFASWERIVRQIEPACVPIRFLTCQSINTPSAFCHSIDQSDSIVCSSIRAWSTVSCFSLEDRLSRR